MNESSRQHRPLVLVLTALHAVEERLETALEPLGLSLAKFNVLDKLAAEEAPLPLGTLAERCACVRSNITQLVDRLEAEQLVVRNDDPHDRRSVRAELTAEGRERHTAGRQALRQAEIDVFAPFSPEQRETLLSQLVVLAGER
jgi:DNA-binding MarR family transcriptional regulator